MRRLDAMAGRAAACEGGLESCNCVSGHRGELPDPAAVAFGEQDLDAPLTGEEAVQACGALESGRTRPLSLSVALLTGMEEKEPARRPTGCVP